MFGNDAGPVTEGPVNINKFEFGTLAVGGGSGAALFTYLVSPFEAIKARASRDGALVRQNFLLYFEILVLMSGKVETWFNNTQINLASSANTFAAIPKPNEPDVCLVFLKGWAA